MTTKEELQDHVRLAKSLKKKKIDVVVKIDSDGFIDVASVDKKLKIAVIRHNPMDKLAIDFDHWNFKKWEPETTANEMLDNFITEIEEEIKKL